MTDYIPNVNDQKDLPVRSTATGDDGQSQFLSDGNTIPHIAAGSEQVGDLIAVTSEDVTQQVGIVQALATPTDNAATAGDIIELRVEGLVKVRKAAEALVDGDRMLLVATAAGPPIVAAHMAKNTTGAHQCVGAYASGDTYCVVRLNQWPGAKT